MNIGIVCDSYKLEKFKSALTKQNLLYTYMDFNISLKLSIVKVICEEDKIPIIAKICHLLEINFKQSN